MTENDLSYLASTPNLTERAEESPFIAACLRQIALPMTFWGYSEAEIVEELGISKSLVRRYLKEMRRELKGAA